MKLGLCYARAAPGAARQIQAVIPSWNALPAWRSESRRDGPPYVQAFPVGRKLLHRNILVTKSRWIPLVVIASFMLASPAASQSRRPWLRTELGPAQDPGSVAVRSWMERTRLLAPMEFYFNRWVRMPRPVTLRGVECAASDVRWVPEQAAVEVCYRMGVRVAGLLTGPDSVRMAEFPATAFFVMHGVAHAVVDELNLSAPGGDEQAVDEVMALMLPAWEPEASGAFLLRSVRTLHRVDRGWDEWAWVRTHRLTPARLETIACLVYGANPSIFGDYLQGGLLPRARSAGCAAEYRRVYRGLGSRLTPSLN